MKFRFKDERKNQLVEFNDIFPEILEKLDKEKLFTIEALRDIWVNIVGDIMSSHCIPDRIFKKTLFIAVDHSVYSNEIVMMKDVILARIKEKFSGLDLLNVKTEIKKISWKK